MTFTHDDYVAAILELEYEFKSYTAREYLQAVLLLEAEMVPIACPT
jgi:hypothetical protein